MTKQDIKEAIKKAKYQTLKETGKKAGKKDLGIIADGIIAMRKFGDILKRG
jgi:hypothetical protein